ncbi:purine-cytosine permease family protein [Saccharopolyspora sp. 5N102]|uniref:purine-cytosine permease family protein n=1 Tax=Saccharopolyspora sp. 5N102 TaxID=3375155 RepID=UPI0037A1AC01
MVGATTILMGLDLAESIAVIVAGNLLWFITGFISISGPAAGTTGSVISRAMYGVLGNKVVIAITGWLISAPYLALNWSAASVAGIGLAGQLGLSESAALDAAVICAIAAATILIAIYGHATIVRLYTALTVVLTIVFLVVSALVVVRADWSYAPAEPLTSFSHVVVLAAAFTVVASTPLSYANSPDVARHLPRTTSGTAVTCWVAAGAIVPSIVFTSVGDLAATALDMSDPQAALESIMPAWFAPVFVIAVVVNTMANNGMTAYSAGLCMQSIGVRLPRVPAVLVVGVIGTAMTALRDPRLRLPHRCEHHARTGRRHHRPVYGRLRHRRRPAPQRSPTTCSTGSRNSAWSPACSPSTGRG